MEAIIRKWGNSPALRLPASVMKAAGYDIDQKVELLVSKGEIIIKPMNPTEIDLHTLIDAITPDNLHAEISAGPPIGNEIL